jgi:hypothetical protein
MVTIIAGTNLFAMERVLIPQVENSLSLLDREVRCIFLSIIDNDIFKRVFHEDMDDFAQTLGSYPGYLSLGH